MIHTLALFPLPRLFLIANRVSLIGWLTLTSTCLYPFSSSGSSQKLEKEGSKSPAQMPYASGTSFHFFSQASNSLRKSGQCDTSDCT